MYGFQNLYTDSVTEQKNPNNTISFRNTVSHISNYVNTDSKMKIYDKRVDGILNDEDANKSMMQNNFIQYIPLRNVKFDSKDLECLLPMLQESVECLTIGTTRSKKITDNAEFEFGKEVVQHRELSEYERMIAMDDAEYIASVNKQKENLKEKDICYDLYALKKLVLNDFTDPQFIDKLVYNSQNMKSIEINIYIDDPETLEFDLICLRYLQKLKHLKINIVVKTDDMEKDKDIVVKIPAIKYFPLLKNMKIKNYNDEYKTKIVCMTVEEMEELSNKKRTPDVCISENAKHKFNNLDLMNVVFDFKIFDQLEYVNRLYFKNVIMKSFRKNQIKNINSLFLTDAKPKDIKNFDIIVENKLSLDKISIIGSYKVKSSTVYDTEWIFQKCANVTEIILNNLLDHVPAEVANLQKLESLDVTSNPKLVMFPNEIVNVPEACSNRIFFDRLRSRSPGDFTALYRYITNTPVLKEFFHNAVTRSGKKTPAYANSQNVHDNNIVNSVVRSVNIVERFIVKHASYQDLVKSQGVSIGESSTEYKPFIVEEEEVTEEIPFEQVLEKIIDSRYVYVKLSKFKPFFKISYFLENYAQIKTMHTHVGWTLTELLHIVLVAASLFVEEKVTKSFLKILLEQLEEGEKYCFTGKFNRIVSALQGFIEGVEIIVNDEQRLANIIGSLRKNAINNENGRYDADLHKRLAFNRLSQEGYSEHIIYKWIAHIE